MGAHVPRQADVLREGHTAGGAGVRPVAGMSPLVSRQVAGLRERLAAEGALKDECIPRPTLPPRARLSRALTTTFARHLVSSTLAPDHR